MVVVAPSTKQAVTGGTTHACCRGLYVAGLNRLTVADVPTYGHFYSNLLITETAKPYMVRTKEYQYIILFFQ